MSKPYEKYDDSETEDETTDHSRSSSESNSFSNWDASLDLPDIDGSFQEMTVDVVPGNNKQDSESDTVPSRRSCLKRKESKLRAKIRHTGEMDLHLPMYGMPVRKRTCVSFKPSVRVRHVVPTLKLAQDKESLWYQASDYIKIEKRCHLIVQKIKHEEQYGGRTLCSRGLESLMCKSQRRGSKFEGWMSVFCEQEIQRNEGIFDEEKLRIMYRPSSLESSKEAERRGVADEEDVQKYLLTVRAMSRKSC